MPSASASSVVKSAGTGPSSAVTVRGAGSVSTRQQLLGQRAPGSTPVPSTDGTTVTAPPDTSKRASSARAAERPPSSSPRAACSAAGSMATASSPSSWGVKVSDAAIAATGTSAEVAPSALVTVTGAASAGRDRLVEHPLGLVGVDADRLDVDGQLDRRARVPAGRPVRR